MNLKIWISMAVLSLGAIAISACPAADECEEGEQRCISGDDSQVETCTSGVWTASDCDTGEACMTMDSGVEHCMGSM
ncbi:MAG: hypothetical protein KDA24_15780 [Deltaproteobacteria bacterium]|nr:hypothetical protein [Deltaproteobacteria bacterium]